MPTYWFSINKYPEITVYPGRSLNSSPLPWICFVNSSTQPQENLKKKDGKHPKQAPTSSSICVSSRPRRWFFGRGWMASFQSGCDPNLISFRLKQIRGSIWYSLWGLQYFDPQIQVLALLGYESFLVDKMIHNARAPRRSALFYWITLLTLSQWPASQD